MKIDVFSTLTHISTLSILSHLSHSQSEFIIYAEMLSLPKFNIHNYKFFASSSIHRTLVILDYKWHHQVLIFEKHITHHHL